MSWTPLSLMFAHAKLNASTIDLAIRWEVAHSSASMVCKGKNQQIRVRLAPVLCQCLAGVQLRSASWLVIEISDSSMSSYDISDPSSSLQHGISHHFVANCSSNPLVAKRSQLIPLEYVDDNDHRQLCKLREISGIIMKCKHLKCWTVCLSCFEPMLQWQFDHRTMNLVQG